MKKKIIISLFFFIVASIAGGFYIIHSIDRTVSTLNNIIKLHQVEILREHLLIEIKRVQSDLTLKGTPFAKTKETVISHVNQLEEIVNTCFNCHHDDKTLAKLTDFRDDTILYQDALMTVFKAPTRGVKLQWEKENAYKKGEHLVFEIKKMIALTSARLQDRTQKSLNKISHTKQILTFFIMAGPIVAVLFAVFFIGSFTGPLSKLLEATRKLKRGNLDYRVGRLKDEFGELAESFNEMGESLKEHMEKMQRAEQMAYIGEMAAGLAHEIKNPLAGIKLSIEVLSDELDLSDEDRSVLEKIIGEIKRIENLMRGLLNFARPPKPTFKAMDLNRTIENTAATLNFMLRKRGASDEDEEEITLVKELEESIPPIEADTFQLQQVLINLLINAIDAMEEGGELTLRTYLSGTDGYVGVDVSDTGKGLDEGAGKNIFKPFFTTKTKGTGLGLAITKQLVEQNGGDIKVFNNEGKGVTFRVSLPITRPLENGEEE